MSILSETAMRDVYDAKYVSLHVRQTNRAAIGLYRDTLGFSVHEVEKAYCECFTGIASPSSSSIDQTFDSHFYRCRWGRCAGHEAQPPMIVFVMQREQAMGRRRRNSGNQSFISFLFAFFLDFSQTTLRLIIHDPPTQNLWSYLLV
jgi:hypothetical protein